MCGFLSKISILILEVDQIVDEDMFEGVSEIFGREYVISINRSN